MGCLFFSLWLIESNTAPVDTVFYNCFREKFHSVKRPFFIFFKSGTVNDIADMFFPTGAFELIYSFTLPLSQRASRVF